MRCTYTLDEFKTKFDCPEVRDFFQHIDRKTMSVNFYTFFDIDKTKIKAENGHNYSIPFEVAPLLAGMIRAFASSYELNQQGRSKKNDIKISYERYHDYVSKLQAEVDKLEPYQQALIKNFRSYDSAKIIDHFMPLLVERISMLMVMLFCRTQEQTSDNFIELIHQLDILIDSLARQHCQQTTPVPTNSTFIFNNAISNTFHLLADISHALPTGTETQVSSLELTSVIQSALNELNYDVEKDKATFIQEATSKLNNASSTYLSTHQNIIELHESNFKHEISQVERRCPLNDKRSIKSVAQVLHYSQLPYLYQEVDCMVKMVNGYGKYSKLKGKINSYNIDEDVRNSLSIAEQTIFECYKYNLEAYKTDIPENTSEYFDFLKQLVKKEEAFLEHAAEQQATLHQDYHRTYLNNFFRHEINSANFHATFNSLSTMATTLLSQQLKPQTTKEG